jgi:hypothetical protein
MSTKEKIIKRIRAIKDQKILKEILKSLPSSTEEIHILSEDEKLSVMEGLADAEAGRTYSHEESKKMSAEWLGK